MNKMFGWLFNSGDDSMGCGHDHPSEESSYWYKYKQETVDREYWTHRNAVYVKLHPVVTMWVCETCGDVKVLESSEMVGGEDGLIRKQEIVEGKEDNIEARVGAWKNDVDWSKNKHELITDRDMEEFEEYFEERVERQAEGP